MEVKPPEGGEGEPEPVPEPVVEEKKEGEAAEGAEGLAPEQPENLEDSVEVKPVVVPRNFTELDRLAYVVAAIENDTHVVPQGAFKLIPQHEIRRNLCFKGPSKEHLRDLAKYLHFRNVQSPEKKVLVETDESVFREDILDSVDEDKPKGAWCVQVDSGREVATVRSLLWPGYVAYSEVGTGKFGGAYFGDGLKNKDLSFML